MQSRQELPYAVRIVVEERFAVDQRIGDEEDRVAGDVLEAWHRDWESVREQRQQGDLPRERLFDVPATWEAKDQRAVDDRDEVVVPRLDLVEPLGRAPEHGLDRCALVRAQAQRFVPRSSTAFASRFPAASRARTTK